MNKSIRFTKMHGLGNDFVVIDNLKRHIQLTPHVIRHLANRHTGVGFDQCLMIEPPEDDSYDFFYRIYNADGTEVGQCGNGARCLAAFIKQRRLSDKDCVRVKTISSALTLEPLSLTSTRVALAPPVFSPMTIPIDASEQADYYTLALHKETFYLHALNLGNPHGILVDNLLPSLRVLERHGYGLSTHEKFTEGANISWVKIYHPNRIAIATFERGAGPTQACGSAAAAAACCVRVFHQGAQSIEVAMPGGQVTVEWKGGDTPVYITGPVATVFEGRISL